MKTIKVFAQYALMPPFSMKTMKLKRICAQDMHLIPLGSLINDGDVADNIILYLVIKMMSSMVVMIGRKVMKRMRRVFNVYRISKSLHLMRLHSPVSFTSSGFRLVLRLLSNRVLHFYTFTFFH